MTERGLPKVDGPVACPFVAFDDDRDERNTVPDHRHRCYAETPPAPRALAHQDAYCLAAAFPVCPIFQDWARREAAHARRDAPPTGRSDSRGDAPGLLPVDAALAGIGAAAGSGLGDDDASYADEEPIYEDPEPRRNPRRGWASPPPWMNRGEARPGDAGDLDPHGAGSDAAEAGLAGSVADRLAASTRGAGAESGAGASGPGGPAGSGGQPFDDDLQPAEERDDVDPRADEGRNARQPEPAPRHRERDRARTEPADPDGRLANARQGDVDRKREVAPSWERPARLEAYPTLRSRRMPNIALPPILVAVVALLLAALILFLLPGFLGLGSPQASASPTPATQSSSGPLGSLVPTVIPEATQQIYVVQAGDTMSKIATRFHVPLATLVAANKTTIPDPNKLKIGDQVIIPTASAPGTSPAASP